MCSDNNRLWVFDKIGIIKYKLQQCQNKYLYTKHTLILQAKNNSLNFPYANTKKNVGENKDKKTSYNE